MYYIMYVQMDVLYKGCTNGGFTNGCTNDVLMDVLMYCMYKWMYFIKDVQKLMYWRIY